MSPTGARLRIASLLPSATEIVCALGLQDHLVGVTHECDYPLGVDRLPHLTANRIEGVSSSQAIDSAVAASLQDDAHTIYALEEDLLRRLEPDVVLTQALCAVCAVPTAAVEEAVCTMPQAARVVSLDPFTVDDVLGSVEQVGEAVGEGRRARDLADRLRAELDAIRRAAEGAPRPRVFAAEWLDPIFCGGHWVPEMVALAGGADPLGRPVEPSRRVSWEEVAAADPDIVVLMPCGFDAEEVVGRYHEIVSPQFEALRAVHEGRVFAVDATAYYSRPGPRLVDGVRILGRILHPDRLSEKLPPDVAFKLDAAAFRPYH
jgi:iron complex transport system substrate-binding protein